MSADSSIVSGTAGEVDCTIGMADAEGTAGVLAAVSFIASMAATASATLVPLMLPCEDMLSMVIVVWGCCLIEN